MTPSQLQDRYKLLSNEQIKDLSSMHRKAADHHKRETAFMERELKRRQRNKNMKNE